MDNPLKKTIVLVVFACLGLAAFILLLGRFYPHRAANIRISRTQAMKAAAGFMEERGYDLSDYHVMATMDYDEEAFIFLQENYGFDAAQDMIRYKPHRGLEYAWTVLWFKNLPRNAPQERFQVSLAGRGDVIRFRHVYPVTFDWPRPGRAHLTQDEALEIATAFLNFYEIPLEEFSKDHFSSNRTPTRTDHTFQWRTASEFDESYTELIVVVQGDEVGSLDIQFEIPEAISTKIKRQSSIEDFFDVVVPITVLFFIGLLAFVVFLKKYHEGEIEVRTATLVFLALMVSFFFQAVLRFRTSMASWSIDELSRDGVAAFTFIILVLIIRPIMSLFGFAAWGVGESHGREQFGDKFLAIDGLAHKRFFTLNSAWSTLQGYCAGFVGLGLVAVLSWVLLRFFGCTTQLGGYQPILAVSVPFVMPLLFAVSGSLLAEMVFRLFLNVFAQHHLKIKALAVVISAAFWAFYVPGFWGINVSLYPLHFELLVWFVLGIFYGIVFWQYDLLAVILANFVTMGVMESLPMIMSPSDVLFRYGLLALILLSLPLVPMLIGFIRRERFTFKADRLPAHIRKITERVRMAKELEIARRVQMQLLPKKSPYVPGFEISGVCIPAKEVGGDYFDFIELGEKRLGIVIGDVSGKGVPAAIYMTLTKGIVQSHADDFVTPKDVLIKVNNLLYKTIDRGTFISLFYAVLDVGKKKLVYARAGHNPVLYFRKRDGLCRLLEPEGIALGLERGELFAKKIQEKTIKLEKGDLLVFYTDGFTEAMNREREEYGEKRLMRIIQGHCEKSVKEIYDAVLRDIKLFVKDTPQNDDMTMVFLKGQ